LKGFIRQCVRPKKSTMEGYLIQETMIKCHDVIGNLDEYTPRIWKEHIVAWKIGMIFIITQIISKIFMKSKHINWVHVQWGE
jgi:hypothetical protein